MSELLDVIHDICNNVDIDTTEGDVMTHERVTMTEWEDGTDWVASSDCSCGTVVYGRCCSRLSARQWLATNFHHHTMSDRHPFESSGEIIVTVVQ